MENEIDRLNYLLTAVNTENTLKGLALAEITKICCQKSKNFRDIKQIEDILLKLKNNQQKFRFKQEIKYFKQMAGSCDSLAE